MFSSYLRPVLNLSFANCKSSSIRGLVTTGHLNGMNSRETHPRQRIFKKIENLLIRDGKEHKIKRSQLTNWNFDMELKTFSNRFKENFDLELLKQALIDTSYVQSELLTREKLGLTYEPLDLESNDRLASTGIKLIRSYSHNYLQKVFPFLPDEGVTVLVDYLSSDELMCKIGKSIGLKDLILTNDYIPSDKSYSTSFKAIVGALKNSSGVNKAQLFVRDFVISHLSNKDIVDIWQIEEPFNTLKDILKRSGVSEAEPRILRECGIGTIEASYEVGIYVNKEIVGQGYGESTSVAVEMAALNVLQKIFKIDFAANPFPVKYGPTTLPENIIKSNPLKKIKINDVENIYTC